MGFSHLVERMVPLVAELFATLMQSDPLRMDFANIAKKTVYDIIGQLRSDGMTNEQIAQALDLSMAGFYKRVRELRKLYEEPGSKGGATTLWEELYGSVHEHTEGSVFEAMSFAALSSQFHYVSDERLRAALRYLVRYNLLMVSGEGAAAEYRVVPRTKRGTVTAQDILVKLYADGPASSVELAEVFSTSNEHIEALVQRLEATDRLYRKEAESEADPVQYGSRGFHIAFDADEGYEAALWDHFQAVCRSICRKLRLGQHQARLHDVHGGTTFTFDVPAEHPLYEELSGYLRRTRQRMDRWLEQVESIPRGDDESRRVRITIYTGQMVEELDGL